MITGDALLLVTIIGLAGFLTWFSSRRRNVLLSVLAGLCWFGISMWLFFDGGAPFSLADNHAKILVWVFFGLTFLPLILYMNIPITHSRGGTTWTEYVGEVPKGKKVSSYDEYSKAIRRVFKNGGLGGGYK